MKNHHPWGLVFEKPSAPLRHNFCKNQLRPYVRSIPVAKENLFVNLWVRPGPIPEPLGTLWDLFALILETLLNPNSPILETLLKPILAHPYPFPTLTALSLLNPNIPILVTLLKPILAHPYPFSTIAALSLWPFLTLTALSLRSFLNLSLLNPIHSQP